MILITSIPSYSGHDGEVKLNQIIFWINNFPKRIQFMPIAVEQKVDSKNTAAIACVFLKLVCEIVYELV